MNQNQCQWPVIFSITFAFLGTSLVVNRSVATTYQNVSSTDSQPETAQPEQIKPDPIQPVEPAGREKIFANESTFKLFSSDISALTERDFAILETTMNWPQEFYGFHTFPNEVQPILLKQLSPNHQPDGNYISVGAERCFISAALLQVKEKIYCFDYDHGVYLFGLINLTLIKASSSLDDYLSLRLQASAEQ
jgi:hypothetical protein